MCPINQIQCNGQELSPIANAIANLAHSGSVKERSAIYTKLEVVDFILDLVGYTSNRHLSSYRLLEPSFGNGRFILRAVERLLESIKREQSEFEIALLSNAIRAVELHKETFEKTKNGIQRLMLDRGVPEKLTDQLLDIWLIQDDFLLKEFDQDFTHIIGNPPYLRQEEVPDVLMCEYRKRYPTIYDRADVYVPFIEQSLNLLSPTGKLSFICADRWMKNRYGKKLRDLVSKKYELSVYVDMVGSEPFTSDVTAYPAITLIGRQAQGQAIKTTRVAKYYMGADFGNLRDLAIKLTAEKLPKSDSVLEFENVATGSEPWLLDDFDMLKIVKRLEVKFPTIEDAGCKVGIGVATGADKAFIGNFAELDVEPSRKLPLVMTKDIVEGKLIWRGIGVINPFADDGKLVELEEYPLLKRYLQDRHEEISARHVAIKNPKNWYRTIDRIYPELMAREKLLIPDIKGDAAITYEGGDFYPHHNLYYITSESWDIRALQAVLQSGIARLFVALYSTKMRGGYFRFQAQYLRRIRLPLWEDLSPNMRKCLKRSNLNNNLDELNAIVASLYDLTETEMKLIAGARAQ